MKSWWEARKGWHKFALALVAYILFWDRVTGWVTGFFGGSGATESAPVPDSVLMLLLVVLGSLLLISLAFVVMMARTVGATVQDTRFAPTTDFRMPHRVGGDLLPAGFGGSSARPSETVDALEGLGFRRAGSYDVQLADHTAVFACMICPEGSTIAVVTSVHLTMQSDFGGKVVVTADRNTGATNAPWVLHQVAPRRSPATVWKAHQKALGVLALRGLVPTVVQPGTASTIAVGIDHASVTHFTAGKQTRSMLTAFLSGSNRPIDGSARSQQAIDRWLAFPTGWTDVD